MTLIMSVSYKEHFVIASSDSSCFVAERDEEGTIIPETYSPAPFLSSDKVVPISDKVFLLTSGLHFASEILRQALRLKVAKDDDLEECTAKLDQLIKEIKGETNSKLSAKLRATANELLEEKGASICLMGFYRNGNTGRAYYDIDTKKIVVTPSSPKGYPIWFAAPNKSDYEYENYLALPKEERTLENYMVRMVQIQAKLSKTSLGISSDCNLHVLVNNGGNIQYDKYVIDTSEI